MTKEFPTEGRECPHCGSHRIVDKYDENTNDGYEKCLNYNANGVELTTKGT